MPPQENIALCFEILFPHHIHHFSTRIIADLPVAFEASAPSKIGNKNIDFLIWNWNSLNWLVSFVKNRFWNEANLFKVFLRAGEGGGLIDFFLKFSFSFPNFVKVKSFSKLIFFFYNFLTYN